MSRDKASLGVIWLKDWSLEGSESLFEPGVIAAQIVEGVESALAQMRLIAEGLGEGSDETAIG